MCASVACARVPVDAAGDFQPDDDPARNHYLKADPGEQSKPDSRFTSDQELGNIFYLSGRRPKLRKPVRRFIDRAIAAFPRHDPDVPRGSIRTRIQDLAANILGKSGKGDGDTAVPQSDS